MKTKALGKDGPQVSIICFGAWPIGGGLGSVPEEQGIAAVHAALDVGMTFIDTAEGYQTSESALGKALKGRRHEAFLATKLSGSDHSVAHMNAAIDNSLLELGTDHIDLYQLHSAQPQWSIADTMAGLMRLREQGKIRYIGVSNFSPEQTKEAMEFCPFVWTTGSVLSRTRCFAKGCLRAVTSLGISSPQTMRGPGSTSFRATTFSRSMTL